MSRASQHGVMRNTVFACIALATCLLQQTAWARDGLSTHRQMRSRRPRTTDWSAGTW